MSELQGANFGRSWQRRRVEGRLDDCMIENRRVCASRQRSCASKLVGTDESRRWQSSRVVRCLDKRFCSARQRCGPRHLKGANDSGAW